MGLKGGGIISSNSNTLIFRRLGKKDEEKLST